MFASTARANPNLLPHFHNECSGLLAANYSLLAGYSSEYPFNNFSTGLNTSTSNQQEANLLNTHTPMYVDMYVYIYIYIHIHVYVRVVALALILHAEASIKSRASESATRAAAALQLLTSAGYHESQRLTMKGYSQSLMDILWGISACYFGLLGSPGRTLQSYVLFLEVVVNGVPGQARSSDERRA